MQPSPRFTINRHLFILLPKQPALDWILRVDPEPPDLTLESLRRDQDAFLVPDGFADPQEAERWIRGRWKMLFESFLMGWYTEESWWPKKRTPAMFNDWFDIQYHSMVWDMAADEPVEHEDWEALDD